MKQNLRKLILNAVNKACDSGALSCSNIPEVVIDVPKFESHGDYSTNIAMVMASIQKMAPRKIAQCVVDCMDDPMGLVAKTEIAGPGFINFHLSRSAWHPVLRNIHEQDMHYGASTIGKGK
jgi:arginyl-tRNA synthetase